MSIYALCALLGLAAVLGFAAHRASICTVRAVEEILGSRRGFMLAGFLKSVLWVVGVTTVFAWFGAGAVRVTSTWSLGGHAIAGGMVFGMGAVINGGCAFSTLTRLADGNCGMLVSLAGLCLGVVAYGYLLMFGIAGVARSAPPLLEPGDGPLRYLALLLIVWMAWELRRLWLTRERSDGWTGRVLAPRYRISTCALLMGGANAVLFVSVGGWAYTQTLKTEVDSLLGTATPPAPMLWGLFAGLFLGMLLSALQRRRFVLRMRPDKSWWGHLVGGAFMGLGASLAPGGNDQLILRAMPALSPHALPAFFSMIVAIALTLILSEKLLGRAYPRVSCGGDICRED